MALALVLASLPCATAIAEESPIPASLPGAATESPSPSNLPATATESVAASSLLGAAAPEETAAAEPPDFPLPADWLADPALAARVKTLLAKRPPEASLASRLVDLSAQFIGVPYVSDPLGEGPRRPPDVDPQLRFDAFDCQTYVETILALALAKDPQDLHRCLSDIRYQGRIDYESRNHFFDVQWVPVNARKGYLRERTAELAGELSKPHLKQVMLAQWEKRRAGRSIRVPAALAPIGSYAFHYVPLDRVMEMAAAIPSGTLFTVVREDKPLYPFMVTHVGFIVQTPQGTVARHAGRDRYGRVVDEPLSKFVYRNGRNRIWKILGMQFFELLEPPPRPMRGR